MLFQGYVFAENAEFGLERPFIDRRYLPIWHHENMNNSDYRNQALKVLPWVCGKCGRDFSGKKLRELTVHHKDHNHRNNPPDGSNWELLCIYCHDNEHSRSMDAEWLPTNTVENGKISPSTHTPFADLLKKLDQSGPGKKETKE